MNEIVKLLGGDQLYGEYERGSGEDGFSAVMGRTPCSTEFMKQVLP